VGDARTQTGCEARRGRPRTNCFRENTGVFQLARRDPGRARGTDTRFLRVSLGKRRGSTCSVSRSCPDSPSTLEPELGAEHCRHEALPGGQGQGGITPRPPNELVSVAAVTRRRARRREDPRSRAAGPQAERCPAGARLRASASIPAHPGRLAVCEARHPWRLSERSARPPSGRACFVQAARSRRCRASSTRRIGSWPLGHTRCITSGTRISSPFTGKESFPRFSFIGVPHTGHASDGSSTRRLRVSFLVIVHLFVKGDNQAIGAEQELDVQRLAGHPRQKHVEPLAGVLRSETAAAVCAAKPPKDLERVPLVEAEVERGEFRRAFRVKSTRPVEARWCTRFRTLGSHLGMQQRDHRMVKFVIWLTAQSTRQECWRVEHYTESVRDRPDARRHRIVAVGPIVGPVFSKPR
jgi:hypothetical protein